MVSVIAFFVSPSAPFLSNAVAMLILKGGDCNVFNIFAVIVDGRKEFYGKIRVVFGHCLLVCRQFDVDAFVWFRL
jgi:uncharacterized membrane protein